MVVWEQKLYHAMFNALSDAVVFTNCQQKIQLVNAAFLTLFGHAVAEVLGQAFDVLYADRADNTVQATIDDHGDVAETAKPFDVQYRRRDGSSFIGETMVTVVKDVEGHRVGSLVVIRDITARRQADSLLQANLARLAKKHRYEAIISSVAHSVHQSTSLQAVLDHAVDAMRTHIAHIDGIEIFLLEGQEAVLKAHCGLPEWLVAEIQRLPAPQGYTCWRARRRC